jgi:hypothetical protein
MSKKIQDLLDQCELIKDKGVNVDTVKFNRLLGIECARALQPMLTDSISRGQAIDLLLKHFEIN